MRRSSLRRERRRPRTPGPGGRGRLASALFVFGAFEEHLLRGRLDLVPGPFVFDLAEDLVAFFVDLIGKELWISLNVGSGIGHRTGFKSPSTALYMSG